LYVTLEPHQASYYGVCRLQVPRRLSQRLAGRLISTDRATVLPRREHCRPAPRVDRLSDFPVGGPMPSTASRRGRCRWGAVAGARTRHHSDFKRVRARHFAHRARPGGSSPRWAGRGASPGAVPLDLAAGSGEVTLENTRYLVPPAPPLPGCKRDPIPEKPSPGQHRNTQQNSLYPHSNPLPAIYHPDTALSTRTATVYGIHPGPGAPLVLTAERGRSPGQKRRALPVGAYGTPGLSISSGLYGPSVAPTDVVVSL